MVYMSVLTCIFWSGCVCLGDKCPSNEFNILLTRDSNNADKAATATHPLSPATGEVPTCDYRITAVSIM